GERRAVVEHERRDAQRRVEVAEHVAPVRAIDDVDEAPLVVEAEMREQQPRLVAVAGDGIVVEEHQLTAPTTASTSDAADGKAAKPTIGVRPCSSARASDVRSSRRLPATSASPNRWNAAVFSRT